jgi:hypothetical protein
MVASMIVPLVSFSPWPSGAAAPHRTAAGRDRAVRADGGSDTPWSRRASARGRSRYRQNAASPANIVKRLFHRRVRQVEPFLHKVDPQYPLHPNRRAAITWLRIDRLNLLSQRRPRHRALHLGLKRRPPRRLAVALKSCARQRQLLHQSQPMRTDNSLHMITRSWQTAFAGVP